LGTLGTPPGWIRGTPRFTPRSVATDRGVQRGVPASAAGPVCKPVSGERRVHAAATPEPGGEDERQCPASAPTSPLRPRTGSKQAASHTPVRPTGSAPLSPTDRAPESACCECRKLSCGNHIPVCRPIPTFEAVEWMCLIRCAGFCWDPLSGPSGLRRRASGDSPSDGGTRGRTVTRRPVGVSAWRRRRRRRRVGSTPPPPADRRAPAAGRRRRPPRRPRQRGKYPCACVAVCRRTATC